MASWPASTMPTTASASAAVASYAGVQPSSASAREESRTGAWWAMSTHPASTGCRRRCQLTAAAERTRPGGTGTRRAPSTPAMAAA